MFFFYQVAGIFGAMAVSFLNLFYYIQVATGDATPKWLYWFLGLISPTAFALGMDKVIKCLEIYYEIAKKNKLVNVNTFLFDRLYFWR